MSYCRFCPANNPYGWPPSDLYVYLDRGGYLLCCGCKLEINFAADRTADMVAHVEEHKRAGHVVREDLLPALLADAAENDKWMREYDAEKEGLA